MTGHDVVAAYATGVAVAVCSCGWRERLEHGTRGQAQTIADEHRRLSAVLDEALAAHHPDSLLSCW